MTWARLDDDVNSNTKITVLSDAAFRLWACGLVYSQKELTDGFIPEHVLKTFPVKRRPSSVLPELLESLVKGKAPLWHKADGGYQIHDYLSHNDSAADIRKARELGRDRLNRFRQRHGDVTKRVTNGAETPFVRSSTTTTTTTTTKEQEPKIKPPRAKSARSTADEPPLFTAFWDAYPRHEKRAKAANIWAKLAPDGALVGRIMSALEWQRNQPKWLEKDGKYIPHATTWLNDRRWEDEPFHTPQLESSADQLARIRAGKGVLL
jgi:hypothetical protein